MEDESRSQRRQQILAGAGILGGLAGGLALKLLEKRKEDEKSKWEGGSRGPATSQGNAAAPNAAPLENSAPSSRSEPVSNTAKPDPNYAAQPDPYLSAQAAFLDAQLTQVEEAIAVGQEETLAAVGAAPKRSSLPQPRYSEQPTQGPPLTRQISDAVAICFTFFCFGLLLNDAHHIADTKTKERFWKFLDAFWANLDENTKNLIVRTPDLWVWLQNNWLSLTPLQQKAIIDYYKEWFEWFGEQSDTWAKRTV